MTSNEIYEIFHRKKNGVESMNAKKISNENSISEQNIFLLLLSIGSGKQ